ncbi:MAG TPA: hypothetical protein VEI97_15250, partial [bacterium]|nr:hypothetical protein [bacterium]
MAPGRFRIGLDQIRHRAHPKEFPTPDARDLALAQTIRRTLRQGRKGVPAITPFAAGDLYLGVPLFPRQALLLRLLYGKPSREDRHDLWRLIDSPTPEAGLYPPPGWPRTPITQVCLIMGR